MFRDLTFSVEFNFKLYVNVVDDGTVDREDLMTEAEEKAIEKLEELQEALESIKNCPELAKYIVATAETTGNVEEK